MQRFFVEPYQVQEEEHRITLSGSDLNHMKNVLRMRIGEDVWERVSLYHRRVPGGLRSSSHPLCPGAPV